MDGDNETELEAVKLGRVSVRGFMSECVCKQDGRQREELYCVSERKEPGGGL